MGNSAGSSSAWGSFTYVIAGEGLVRFGDQDWFLEL